MKKGIISTAIVIGAILAVILVFIIFAPAITSRIASSRTGMDISMRKIFWSPKEISIGNLNIGNPKKSTLQPAFSVKTMEIGTTLKQLRGSTLTIDKIAMNDILINVEEYNDADQNNWKLIMASRPKKERKGDERPYLIKELKLANIEVVLKNANGQTKRFPPIKSLAFYNISNESGFSINEIEKAILHAILKQSFIQNGIQNLIKFLNPVNLNPLQIVPKIIPFSYKPDFEDTVMHSA